MTQVEAYKAMDEGYKVACSKWPKTKYCFKQGDTYMYTQSDRRHTEEVRGGMDRMYEPFERRGRTDESDSAPLTTFKIKEYR